MGRRIKHCAIFLIVLLGAVTMVSCNKSAETGNQGTPTPSVTLTPIPEPTITPVPTATPIPTREDLLAMPWFDEYKIIDCEEYYFEMLSFKERTIGGYAMEGVFENRQQFAVYVGISDVYINFLRHPYDSWPLDWSGIMIGPGKKETVEFWVPDYYVEQLGIKNVEDFNCVSLGLYVDAVDDINIDYGDYEEIMFYQYGRENMAPHEHVLEEDDVALVDREDVKFYLTDFIQDDYGVYTVNFYWENNTEHHLYYRFYNESVNGYMCDSFWKEEVSLEPGTCGYDSFGFQAYDLEKCGITSVTEIEFDLSLYYDALIWQWKDYVKDTFCVYPLGQDAVQTYKRELQTTDLLVFDTEDYKMVITGFSEDSSGGVLWGTVYEYIIHVYVENKTDRQLQFVVNEAKINGDEYKAYYNRRSVCAGKNMYMELSWEDKEWIKNYPDLDSLELAVQIKNMDDEKQSIVWDESFIVIP